MKSRLEDLYRKKIVPTLQKDLGYKNVMQVPRLSKIVLNIGVKDAVVDSKVLNTVQEIIESIAGQAVVRTHAKKSIAGFKLREGVAIGIMVTLRNQKMYDFLDKFVNVALPRVRDFGGLPTKLDGSGNFNIGIKDWLIFPEVDYDKIDKIRGLNITIQTTARNDHDAVELLKGFNIPFKKKEVRGN